MVQQLKARFQDLLKTDSHLFDWIMDDAHQGIWFCNTAKPKELWVSDSFLKTLEFDYSSIEVNTKSYSDIVLDLINNGENSFDRIFNLPNANNEIVTLHAFGKKISTDGSDYLAVKFSKEKNIHKTSLLNKIDKLKKLNQIYESTNEIARVGGWESDLLTRKLIWTDVTKDIHEVERDYEPTIEDGIEFFEEGWSRNKLISIFTKAIEQGIPFDDELKIITATGREVWVRGFGQPVMENGKCIRIYGAFQDITDKKQQELDYQLSKERFETIYNNSSVGIVLISAVTGKVLMANPATFDMFGFSDQDMGLMGNISYRETIHPDDLAMAQSYRERLTSGEISNYVMESRFFTKSGAIIWCRVNTSMVCGMRPQDNLIITQIEDITISKRLEEVATENSTRFISAFEYSPNGMALVGLDGTWLMVNETLSQMLGYNREEFLKLTFQDMTHYEDLAADLELLNETVENKRNTYSIEKRYIHKDGSIVYGLLNVSLIRDAEQNPQYFISQINDITQRVEAEQELQESLHELENFLEATTQVAIIQTDTNGTIIKYNKGAENLLGYTSEDLVGMHNVGIFHVPEEVEKRARELKTRHGKTFSGFDIFTFKPKQGKFDAREWTYIRKDGSKFPVHLVITSVRDQKGEITGYLGIATDISRLKEMETSLLLARDKAETASKSKSEFLANMSHEIRTPLNGVIGFTDLLMKTELSENQRKYMQMANTSAHSLLDIINDILDFSKIEAGKLELNYDKTDIIELCSQTIDIIKHQAHAKSLEILLDISPDISRFVYADAVRLRQIIVNLLGNAVKFTTQGEVELKVRAVASGTDAGEMIFSFAIRDTGIGIAPQNLEKIFNAFDQEDASTTRKYGGTGLGITISNRLLALMGSSLHVESEVNKGSTFSFKIKFKVETGAPQKQVKVNIKKVLIVDDNATNLIILKDMLGARKISTTLASNGIEALEILEKDNNFDLAIIDYNMPYLNGIELVAQIRQTLELDTEKLPIMLLHSSTDDEKLIQATIDLDIRFNVTKPIISDQLFLFLDNIHRTHNEEVALLAEDDKTEGFDAEYTIMVAEDNPVNQMLTKTIIQQIAPNATIVLAENGREAVEMFQKQVPDIIFMDIQMPEMSGFEATEKIREIEEKDAHLPIVALTARALKGEREECLKLGMDDYITKPIVFETLRAVIEKYLVEPYNLNKSQD